MTDTIPTIGRIVRYVLDETDVGYIEARRKDFPWMSGNNVYPGHVYPAEIVRTWGDKPDSAVNLQVALDGYDTHWVTNVKVGTSPGTYHWPQQAVKNTGIAGGAVGASSNMRADEIERRWLKGDDLQGVQAAALVSIAKNLEAVVAFLAANEMREARK